MECNKDEAVRARDLAEKKMQLKDFGGAKKFAIKAQQLFPDLDGISQMLTVCEVHCAAEVKINGSDDWYGILQVQPIADELSIKKQYRKLALLLHPDKNKFPGAEAAFKLIGEANRILSDQSKRSFYDMKRTTSFGVVKPKLPTQQAKTTSFPNGQHGPTMRNNFHNVHFTSMNHEQPQTQTAPTFWTSCPFCRIRYQYYRTIMNRSLRCQNCMKPFVAYDLSSQNIPAGTASGYPQNKVFSGRNAYDNSRQSNQSNAPGESTTSQPSQDVEAETDVGRKFRKNEKKKNQGGDDGKKEEDVRYEKIKLEEMNRRGGGLGAKTSGSPNKKRNRRITDSGDSASEDGFCTGKNVDNHANNPRKSNRQKQNVTYDEDRIGVDEDEVASLKRSRRGKFSADEQIDDDSDRKAGSREHEDDICNGHDKVRSEKSSGVGTCSKVDSDVCDAVPDVCHYPDPEFYDFEQKRSANSFATGQIWALYDDLDGMPRFYARIKNVVIPDFKVRFTWLEHDAIGQSEIDWSEKELPAGSGSFKLGSSQTSEDLPMFSHLMLWDRGSRKNSYVIRPRRNEIWALFKSWDMKWAYEPNIRKSYEYEIVEILSGDAEAVISVMPLIKIKGFVSVFAQSASEPIILHIQPGERLRFSHMIPSHKLTGSERKGIPSGSYELDPASLPVDFEKIYPSMSFTLRKPETKSGDTYPETGTSLSGLSAKVNPTAHQMKLNERRDRSDIHETSLDPSQDQAANAREKLRDEIRINECHEKKINSSISNEDDKLNGSLDSCPKDSMFEYPEPEFHDFSSEKSLDKLKCGQIWALYSDIDGFPKYYAFIKDVDVNDSKVYLTWLEGCPLLEDELKWAEKELPLSCGQFRILRGKGDSEVYESLEAFSHLVPAKQSEKKHRYEIYPCIGEVWAMYRNWTAEWEESDLSNCEYDVVEILKIIDYSIEVLFLVKVKGYNSVFEPKRVNGVISKAQIPRASLVKLSHCIPAFRLTEERGGKLRGFWELDPAAVPELVLCS